jgi:hypothetical protein
MAWGLIKHRDNFTDSMGRILTLASSSLLCRLLTASNGRLQSWTIFSCHNFPDRTEEDKNTFTKTASFQAENRTQDFQIRSRTPQFCVSV